MNRADWNRRYSGPGLVWSSEPNRFLVEEVSGLPSGSAVDLAAGEGRNALWLAERGWRVTAVDHAEVGLVKGRQAAAERDLEIEWVVADLLEHDPGAARFDLVLLFYLHLPWDSMRPVLRRAARACARGGTFLLVGHDRTNLQDGYGGPRDPGVLYTPADVVGELADLRVVEAARRLRPVDVEWGPVNAIDCLVRAVAEPCVPVLTS